MADLPLSAQPHRVTVETRTGVTATGEVFAPGMPVRCFRDARRGTVLTIAGRQEVTTMTIYTTAEACGGRHPMDLFTEGSRVTWEAGSGAVKAAWDRSDGGMGAWQHVEVAL